VRQFLLRPFDLSDILVSDHDARRFLWQRARDPKLKPARAVGPGAGILHPEFATPTGHDLPQRSGSFGGVA